MQNIKKIYSLYKKTIEHVLEELDICAIKVYIFYNPCGFEDVLTQFETQKFIIILNINSYVTYIFFKVILSIT